MKLERSVLMKKVLRNNFIFKAADDWENLSKEEKEIYHKKKKEISLEILKQK